MTFDIAEKLFPNPFTMLVQLCATAVLFYFVVKLLWKPARNFIDKRASLMQKDLENASNKSFEAKKLNDEAQKRLKDASNEAFSIIEKSKEEATRVKDKIVKDGRVEAENKLEAARKEIDYEKEMMRKDIHDEIVSVALVASEKLLGTKISDSSDKLAIEQFVKEVNAK